MVDIPLSKKGWVSTITTILLSPIMAGFFNALGADVYQASKTMAFDTQTPYSGYPYENIVIAVNVTLIVIDIRNEKRKRSVTNLNVQNDIPNNSNPVDEDDVETRRKKEELPASQQDSDSYVLEEWTIILRI